MSTNTRQYTSIRLQADPKGQHADLYLIGRIGDSGWWSSGTDNTATRILDELRSQPNLKTIDVYLATIGGNFLDGLPIYNLLKQHTATVTVNVIGYALSMGSVIMLAGNKIRAAQNAMIMIHNAQGYASGSAADMRKTADVLQMHESAIIPQYCKRLGKNAAEVQSLLDAETWYNADTALAAGLIDEIIDPVDLDSTDAKQPENAWQFATANFKRPPAEFVERLEAALEQQRPWAERFLNRIVGKPPILLTQPETAEVDMTPEEITAAVEAAASKAATSQLDAISQMMDNKLSSFKPAEQTPDEPAESPEMTALKAELAAANAKVAELSTPAPGTILNIPLSTGAVADTGHFS